MFQRFALPFCVGLDIHKDNVYAAVCMTRPKTNRKIIRTRKFNINHTDLVSMTEWIHSFHPDFISLGYDPADPSWTEIHVYMESTGKYTTPVFNVLEEMKFSPHIVNPKHVRMINGQKTDQKDCSWIAELASNGLLHSSYVPCQSVRDARRISRLRTKLVHERGSCIRRMQNILVEANIRMDLIFSDTTGWSAQRVIRYLLDTDEPSLWEIRNLIHSRCHIMRARSPEERKEKEEKLFKAFNGARFSLSQKFELRSVLNQIASLDQQILAHETMMAEILTEFETQLNLLQEIPGISRLSAMQILAEIGPDMNQFPSVKQFISWCGLCPASNQSNGKHKSVRIGKGGKYLKPILIQCAMGAVKCSPYYAKKFKKIKTRRGSKRAYIAIARKLMVAAYHMLLNGESFNPSDPDEAGSNDNQTQKTDAGSKTEEQSERMVPTIDEAVQALIRHGINIDSITAQIQPLRL